MDAGADILIVEDDKDLVNTVRIVLESKKYRVRWAYNGKEGYSKIREKIPDLMILDVMMQTDTDGFDLAYKLKNEKKFQNIPILMITSFPQKMVEEGPEKFQHILGETWPVTQFLEKPVDPEELLSVVGNILKEKRQ
jgi:DNA-binding response OmpR family regulator